MGRTLPWKQTGSDIRRLGSAASSPVKIPTAATPALISTPTSTTSTPTPTSVPAPTAEHERTRSPSVSNTTQPVPESFMIPGLLNDDQWRMVEDEFVHVAHKFTAQLHAAEYQRLKERAQNQDARVIGPIIADTERPHNPANRVITSPHNPNVDDLPWAGTHLEDLMESPRKKKPLLLNRINSSISVTRAAALSRPDSTSKKNTPVAQQGLSASRPGVTAIPTRPSVLAEKHISTSTTTRSGNDDSDSSVENEFQRLRKERRKRAKISRRTS